MLFKAKYENPLLMFGWIPLYRLRSSLLHLADPLQLIANALPKQLKDFMGSIHRILLRKGVLEAFQLSCREGMVKTAREQRRRRRFSTSVDVSLQLAGRFQRRNYDRSCRGLSLEPSE